LLQAVVDNPGDNTPNLILADWLEEHDDPRRAELLRLNLRLRTTCCDPDQHPERAEQQARLVQLLADGVRPCVPQRTIRLGKRVEMTFAWIPPGAFLMGQKRFGNDETQHQVTLTKGLSLGIYPVTQAQWRAVMGANASRFKGANRPVEMVSHPDCQEFCEKLSAREGTTYRLPTEAEWEYACRAGTTTWFHFGWKMSGYQVECNCNYPHGKKEKSREKTTPVGGFPANAWGLYDLHGNVWEWCQDWYGDYPQGNSIDPQGASEGKYRVVRGGSWATHSGNCYAAIRGRYTPTDRSEYWGCRVCFLPA